MEASPGGPWGANEPERLFEILLQYCASNLRTFSSLDDQKGQYVLHPGVSLPTQVGERLLQLLITEEKEEVDKYLWMFSDPQRCLLRSVNLRDAKLNPESFLALLRQRLIDLDLTRCTSLNDECIRQLRSKARDVRRLILGDSLTNTTVPLYTCANWLSSCSAKVAQNITSEVSEELAELYEDAPEAGPQWPRLQALTVTHTEPEHLASLNLASLRTLTYLDLSRCKVKPDLMASIESLSALYTLILYNVPSLWNVTKSITRLKQLRSLDISHSKSTNPQGNLDFDFPNPRLTLSLLVKGLPMLQRLDISGTNLAQEWVLEEGKDEETNTRSIAGLEEARLDFLGLQDCWGNPCSWEKLPAEQVTGDNTEDQVILATQLYHDKEELLISALNNLFSIFRYSVCANQKTALDAILAGMDRHPCNKRVQITGSASLFYIVKGCENKRLTFKLRRHIVATVLTAMENHMGETTMMHNGCLTLCHFSIPQDMMFVYSRLVKLLLAMVQRDEQDDFLQRIGIYLINGLACQVEAREKRLLGDLGAISSMLHIIRQRLAHNQCDEVMEIAWGAMWNVTDETDINCERFIDGEGMSYFLKCWDVFPNKPELLKNMMGLMGNVAEVAELRPRLMVQEYVRVFCELLQCANDGIEISYNACGVLAHMLSDGPLAWTVSHPDYTEIAKLMKTAIQSWSIRTKRFINYRSFKPILRLLVPESSVSPEAQYWAVWALCNLTTMYPNKYCLLVENDGGFPLLDGVITNARALPDAQNLAQQVLDLCNRYKCDPASVTHPEDDMVSDGED